MVANVTHTPTIWGLDPLQLHAHYWASVGVQVVRQGEPSQLVPHAELFLLIEPHTLPLFSLKDAVRTITWVAPHMLTIRLRDTREKQYRERAITDTSDRLISFQRLYAASGRQTRVVLTSVREIAQLWQAAPDPITGWRRLRRFTPRHERLTMSLAGNVYDRTSDEEIAAFLSKLIAEWKRPDSTIPRAKHRVHNGIWIDPDAQIDPTARLLGNVWIGAGRKIGAQQVVVGPTVVWDDPAARPQTQEIQWLMIEAMPPLDVKVQHQPSSVYRVAKRAFDIVLALIGLVLTLPMWIFIMVATWWEDGRPFFFGHNRETIGGREFKCWKFRSMKNGAENMKDIIAKLNQVDGPQVYIENDPRITRVGRFIRKYNIDEFPQFWNVLTGDMSMVGPRPSPRKENQYCVAWREARLSVRPGITGLWQIRRTRNKGSDFQEWIKYDIEYVENMSFWLDIKIIYKTIEQVVRKGTRS